VAWRNALLGKGNFTCSQASISSARNRDRVGNATVTDVEWFGGSSCVGAIKVDLGEYLHAVLVANAAEYHVLLIEVFIATKAHLEYGAVCIRAPTYHGYTTRARVPKDKVLVAK
jgi:hypothetical protein